jgi:uncharacterized protein YqeY
MSLQERLSNDLKEAMRAQDQVYKRTLRSVIAAIKAAETELDSRGRRVTLGEEDLLAILAKQAKQRRESIFEYRKGGREDLVAEEQAELAVLEEYLPQQLGRDEIEAEARQAIAEVGATGRQHMGKVMRTLMKRLRGRADGKVVNEVVTELLTGQES